MINSDLYTLFHYTDINFWIRILVEVNNEEKKWKVSILPTKYGH